MVRKRHSSYLWKRRESACQLLSQCRRMRPVDACILEVREFDVDHLLRVKTRKHFLPSRHASRHKSRID